MKRTPRVIPLPTVPNVKQASGSTWSSASPIVVTLSVLVQMEVWDSTILAFVVVESGDVFLLICRWKREEDLSLFLTKP